MSEVKDQTLYQLSGQEVLLSRYLIEDTTNAMIFIRIQVRSLNKCSFKKIACNINDELKQLSP